MNASIIMILFIAVRILYYQLLIMILLIRYFIRAWMSVVTYQIFSFFPGWGWKVETSSIMEEKVSDQGQESWERGWGGAERDRGSDPTVPPTQSQAGRGGQLNAPPHHRTHDELLTNHRMRDEPLTGSIQDCSTNRQRLCVRIENLWTNYVLWFTTLSLPWRRCIYLGGVSDVQITVSS